MSPPEPAHCSLVWDAPVPPELGVYFPIVSARPGSSVRAVVLSHRVESTWTHWLEGRTVSHRAQAGACLGCRYGSSRRWKGFVAGWLPGPERMVIVEITAAACRSAGGQELLGRNDLRGLWVVIERLGRQNNSQCKMTFGARFTSSVELPEPFDVRESLRKIWGDEEENLGEVIGD